MVLQANCYPTNVTITENKGSVSLQSLLDHTTTRLMQLTDDVLKIPTLSSETKFHLTSKVGFDSSPVWNWIGRILL